MLKLAKYNPQEVNFKGHFTLMYLHVSCTLHTLYSSFLAPLVPCTSHIPHPSHLAPLIPRASYTSHVMPLTLHPLHLVPCTSQPFVFHTSYALDSSHSLHLASLYTLYLLHLVYWKMIDCHSPLFKSSIPPNHCVVNLMYSKYQKLPSTMTPCLLYTPQNNEKADCKRASKNAHELLYIQF